MMFGSDPFAGTITDRPTGITSGGGSPWRPTRGCSARVNWPGGSLPITRRVSMPSPRSASAWSSACSTTAPQKDHENGTTIPTFIGGDPTQAWCGTASGAGLFQPFEPFFQLANAGLRPCELLLEPLPL